MEYKELTFTNRNWSSIRRVKFCVFLGKVFDYWPDLLIKFNATTINVDHTEKSMFDG